MKMPSPNYRMIPDGRKGGGTIQSSGRSVSVAASSFVDLPLEHVNTLNGWTCCGKVGTTTNRPAGASSGETYIDTTLGKVLFADGFGNWHDPFTGGVV